MSGAETTIYLDRLLKVYDEKFKRFRLLLTILLVGTSALFFLICFPYMTRTKLPYFQNTQFYYLIYFVSALLGIYSLVKIGFFYKNKKDI